MPHYRRLRRNSAVVAVKLLDAISSHFLLSSVLCLVAALLLALFLAWWLRRHQVVESAEPPASAGGAELVPASASHAPVLVSAEMPGEMNLAFLRAVQHLRAQTSGRQRLYQAPWFLLLGEAGCGKTTLLEALGAPGADASEGPKPRHGVGWRFFDHGVVLDVPGDLVVRPETLTAHERTWRGLLRLLNRYRPHRPLDGVVLVLPAHDFVPGSALDPAELSRKAARIADKLTELQRESGLCFPVYVVISKCDQIAGFQAFCQALPADRRREIFGWSSPYRAEAAFESAWVDEAFDEIVEALNRAQGELFAERLDALDPASLFFFPGEVLQLRDRLRGFLHQIFRTTAYRESFHCRGLYFCGEAPTETAGAAPVPAASAEDAVPPARVTGLLGLQLPGRVAGPRPVFVEDLFERKIFPEFGLAYPERRTFAFRRGAMLTAQTLTIAVAVILAGGLAWGYYHLNRLQMQAQPVLERVDEDISGSQYAALGQQQPGRNANDLVRNIAQLGDSRFFSVFIPASWSLSLDTRIEDALRVAFERSVLQVTLNELVGKARALGAAATPASPPAAGAAGTAKGVASADAADAADADTGVDEPADTPPAQTLQQLPAYAALADFTSQVGALEQALTRYQHIAQPGDIGDTQDLNALMQYLHPQNAFIVTAGVNSYFARALDAALGPPFPQSELDATRARVRAEMIDRVDALYDAWFDNNPRVAQLQNLSQLIDSLRYSARFSYTDLTNLQASLEAAAALMRDPDSRWMGDPNAIFEGPLRAVTLDPVERSAGQTYGLFYPSADLESYIRQNAATEWQTLHANLAAEETDLTGPLLQFGDHSVRLSPGVEALRLPLADLMNLSFMAGQPGGVLRADFPANSRLTWDPAPLQEAQDMVAAYNRYLNEGLLEAPAGVRDVFRKLALAHLTANMIDQINQAETWSPDIPGAGENQTLAADAAGFRAAAPALTALMQDFTALGQDAARQQLVGLAHADAYSLLHGLEVQLENAAPYSSRGLATWDGSRPASLAAFDLRTSDDLAGYLTYERQQLESLAAAATPLVTFLQQTPGANRSVDEAQLIARWRSLLTAVQQYDNKIPGNSLSALEDYVATGMDKDTPAGQCAATPAPPAGEAPADYFLAVRARLARDLTARCQWIAADTAHRDYATLANLFNRTLAGKFPFADPALAGKVEADPDAIAAFFHTFNQLDPALQGRLDGGPAAEFCRQLESLSPIWSSFLANQAQEPMPVFDVTPTFRVNRARERGGDQVIDWTLHVGPQVFTAGAAGPPTPARWTLNTPITLTLQWAKDSPEMPRRPAAGSAAVHDRSVTFAYDDPWSLFALVAAQRAPAADFEALIDPAPNTLAFTIPVAPAAPAAPAVSSLPVPLLTAAGAAPPAATDQDLVFVRIAITLPGKVESLLLPVFPRQAPPWQ